MNAKEAELSNPEVGYRLGGNTVDGVRTHAFPVFEKVIKMMILVRLSALPALLWVVGLKISLPLVLFGL